MLYNVRFQRIGKKKNWTPDAKAGVLRFRRDVIRLFAGYGSAADILCFHYRDKHHVQALTVIANLKRN